MSVIDMEFPPESYNVFDSDQFEMARARLAGDASPGQGKAMAASNVGVASMAGKCRNNP